MISDKLYFRIVMAITVTVLAVVVALKYLPDEYRLQASFAHHLPRLNAIFNSLVSVCLVFGYYQIRYRKNRNLHRVFMLSAFVLSSLFLVSYVAYHFSMPSTLFDPKRESADWIRYTYYFVLLTHIVLAAVVLPMILYTIYYSTKGDFTRHRKLARFTFPIWLYVAITGVVVYLLISPYYSFNA